jgi:hypothetical protein
MLSCDPSVRTLIPQMLFDFWVCENFSNRNVRQTLRTLIWETFILHSILERLWEKVLLELSFRKEHVDDLKYTVQ